MKRLCLYGQKKKKKAVHLLSKEKLGIVTSLLRETGEFHPPHSFVSPFSPFSPSYIWIQSSRVISQEGYRTQTTGHQIPSRATLLIWWLLWCHSFHDGAGPARMRGQNLAALADRLGFCLCLAANQLLSDRAHQCWFTPDHLVRGKKKAPLPFLATVFCSRHPSTRSLMSH